MSHNTMDLTQGPLLRQLLVFSLPLVAGTLFLQLYSFVDTVMVGRLLGEQALAAVGATYSLHFLTLGGGAHRQLCGGLPCQPGGMAAGAGLLHL